MHGSAERAGHLGLGSTTPCVTLTLAAHPGARIEFLGAVDAVAAYAGLEDEFIAEAARVSALVTAAPLSFPVDLALAERS